MRLGIKEVLAASLVIGCGELQEADPNNVTIINPADAGEVDMGNEPDAQQLDGAPSERGGEQNQAAEDVGSTPDAEAILCNERDIVRIIEWLRDALCQEVHAGFAVCNRESTLAFFQANPWIIQFHFLEEGGYRIYRRTEDGSIVIEHADSIVQVGEECAQSIQEVFTTLARQLYISQGLPPPDAAVEPDTAILPIDAGMPPPLPDAAPPDPDMALPQEPQPQRCAQEEVSGVTNEFCCLDRNLLDHAIIQEGRRIVLHAGDTCDILSPQVRDALTCCAPE